MLEGNRVSRISVRGFAVASATAVTTVGAVVGVASGNAAQPSGDNFEATAADTTLLADIPAGEQAQVQVSSLTEQADVQAAAADASARKSAEEAARLQAAKDAEAKKKAADKAEQERKEAEERAERAEREKREAEERASRDAARDLSSFSAPAQGSYTIAEVKAIARQIIPASQFQCFSNIVDHESGWNYRATNPSSGAYGLVQALPGHKMSSAGADWQTNPATQIKWGLSYMDGRYGSPCGAWSFWQANRWY
ncbi:MULTISPECIES: transglycosylase SLT domain-containing protein [unclassified Streptomyces]|jgi:murein DD-endopeptidase MepM/ murein hydrolase activator NlpD|uniref:aggregation-promoting factor C-terminal-like domain-containing protein n=1 Tax=unclassified Streptomyces TaxID=2593676 RepID=UPI0036CF0913